MEIRLLKENEYERLLELRVNSDWSPTWLPSPAYSQIVIAEEEGEIIGFCVLQQQLHIEPIWVKFDHRGGIVARQLWRGIKSMLGKNPAYCSTKSRFITKLLKRLGFKSGGKTFYYEP